jgi:3-methyladenine DNA glycosylase/8-oxoguanine DNA glycosylase
MPDTIIRLTPQPPFDFENTAMSHGWAELEPTWYDSKLHTLQRVEVLPNDQVFVLILHSPGSVWQPQIEVSIMHESPIYEEQLAELDGRLKHMLRLDDDLSDFYALCAERGGNWLRLKEGWGRLLRSPTVFEDMVKVICTTNVQWGGTKGMLRRLVAAYGSPFPRNDQLHGFPSPQTIANIPFDDFATAVRMGYRTAYVHELATRVAAGYLNLEDLRSPLLPTGEVRKKLLGIKGIGPYAAATILMLLGHYDEIAVDTAFRSFIAKKYFQGRYPSDKEALAIYQDWGKWKYLAYWFDIFSEYSS